MLMEVVGGDLYSQLNDPLQISKILHLAYDITKAVDEHNLNIIRHSQNPSKFTAPSPIDEIFNNTIDRITTLFQTLLGLTKSSSDITHKISSSQRDLLDSLQTYFQGPVTSKLHKAWNRNWTL